jgi:hypothetical protein
VTPSITPSPSSTPSLSGSATISFTPTATASVTASQTATPSRTASVTPVGDTLLLFSFSVAAADGSALSASALAANAAVLGSVAANVGRAIGVDASMVRVVNVTDVATGAVVRVSRRRALAAAGTLGVTFTVAANLGKTATSASVAAKQAALASNFNSTSPFAAQIKADVAAAAGLPAASLGVAPPSGVQLGGNTAGLSVVIIQAGGGAVGADALAADAGIGAAIGVALILLAFCLYSWRSQIVHGALPWQRDRRRELFELKARAAKETEERLAAGSVEATVVSPLATAGKGALTVRVPKAVADELRSLRDAADEDRRQLLALRAAKARDEQRLAELERLRAQLAPAQVEEAAAAAAAAAATAASFAPVPVGGGAAAPPPPQAEWVEARDPASGRSYWFNKASKETTWIRPAGV